MSSLMDAFLGVAQIISGIYTILKSDINNNYASKLNGVFNDFTDFKGGDVLKANFYDVRNIDQRISKLKMMIDKGRVHPKVREIAVKIVSRFCGDSHCIKERDYYNEAKAIFDWVRKYIRYVHDVRGIDTFQHPARTIEFGGGDCDDYTILLASLYLSLGYPVKLKVVQTIKNDDYDHIYLLVGIPPVGKDDGKREWIAADASVNKPFGWEVPKSFIRKHKIYKIKDDVNVKKINT